ncbi:hypothetical protein HRR78_001838 [Exophiala dermatitidis]|nr:hypothetical protein HRR75_002315 [Exophiala dermatitidis]KAJ4556180.1 hypothetical protein HRR78_001838 [Exophiala dermatitidis]
MAARLDDPERISAFLRAMHGTTAAVAADSQGPQPRVVAADHDVPIAATNLDYKMASLTMAADGTAGNNALLPTSPVKEILTTKNANIPPQITHLHVPLLTPTQQKLLRKREDIVETRKDDEVPSMENRAMNYMERVIAQHRLAWDSKVALEPAEKSESGREMPLNPHQLFTDSPDLLAVTDVPEDTVHCSKPETPAFAKETPHCNTPLGHIDSSPPVSPIEFTSSPVPQEEAQEAASASERASSLAEDLHSGGSLSPTYAENSSTDAAKLQAPGAVGVRAYDQAAGNDHEPKIGQDETGKQTKQGGEDREHSTFFKSWGSPAARNKPENRKRTIVLGGLPGTAGFTFVQSLIHGGSIETMKLSSSNSAGTATAFITFTSGDACDRYFAKYPNGIGVRHEGKKHIIFVDKSDRVDIMSSIMQGYLDCGASRVVKATGADEDWGIMALNRLAEGKNKTRAVEAVTDSLQDGKRTILFRFTNISDAVKFKSELMRDYDWEGCLIEFAEDPCAKATDIHHG